ncbi:hypothetical protein YPPY66_0303 [Yersinia pestis PY-66]|uniref:Uncharacterized protein n=1 Tax=Yersinia pseudotuberculosis serotype O:1b (strain IP 31758) TaxID=349747 RepID=A0A0U1R026_YERP3|nr:hypothetical protein YpsIP31758_0117 [Yersinia pseudotuberculosis IP 31758]ADV97034.1 hypothetical protein YPC_0274 [Yersinia pestis biovar Medievalis str. Harbin 35]EDR59419.1 hypothetical protein YpMG051020_2536 [Yersinia pestis biovar Orientalis str. MG05-1020]EDR59519.1 hypothetical protein YpUG050454_3174 [Yersinia pestis biovar Antiqua str. UG05-0454]EEO74652.1 hypothetical protein YP516_4258 [Yersinia pestis Nepal516]EIQ94801.1 hypothetical protein YPPY01_0163 [Yersinia pestis PY-01]
MPLEQLTYDVILNKEIGLNKKRLNSLHRILHNVRIRLRGFVKFCMIRRL